MFNHNQKALQKLCQIETPDSNCKLLSTQEISSYTTKLNQRHRVTVAPLRHCAFIRISSEILAWGNGSRFTVQGTAPIDKHRLLKMCCKSL